jgi:hypothetical protein
MGPPFSSSDGFTNMNSPWRLAVQAGRPWTHQTGKLPARPSSASEVPEPTRIRLMIGCGRDRPKVAVSTPAAILSEHSPSSFLVLPFVILRCRIPLSFV